jgi:alkanesulfonate monooxygenase SsuD/methylene tetrahydromethanopterin reductase-like flavin-dependent oxidoreductase (luciferase family)
MLLPAAAARPITDRYRSEWAALGKPRGRLPKLGLSRHLVLAETEAEAHQVAQRAYRRWRQHMEWLWIEKQVPFPLDLPTEFEPVQALGTAFAGTAAGARAFIAEQVATAGVTYFVCDVAFGDLTLAESLRTTELLGRHVLPAFRAAAVVAPA